MQRIRDGQKILKNKNLKYPTSLPCPDVSISVRGFKLFFARGINTWPIINEREES